MAKRQKVTDAVGVRLDYTRLADLQPHPDNPKAHATEDLLASIARFGFLDPVGIDASSGHIVEGHGRVEALRLLRERGAPAPRYVDVAADGEWLVPTLQGLAFSSPTEAMAYLLAHNQVTLRGGWDKTRLAALLADQRAAIGDLDGIGFTQAEVDALLSEALPTDDASTSGTPSLLEALTLGTGSPISVGASNEATEAPTTPPMPPAQGIKALVLQYDRDTYERIVGRLSTLMEQQKLDSHTAVFEYLLDRFEQEA